MRIKTATAAEQDQFIIGVLDRLVEKHGLPKVQPFIDIYNKKRNWNDRYQPKAGR